MLAVVFAAWPKGLVTIEEARVVKTVHIPERHIGALLHVYATLAPLQVKTLITLERLKVRHAA